MVRLIDSLSMAKILRLEQKTFSLTYLRGPTGQMRLVTETLIERSTLQQAIDPEAFNVRSRNRRLISIMPFLFSSAVRLQIDLSAAYFTYTVASIALFVTSGYMDYMHQIHSAIGTQNTQVFEDVRTIISTGDPAVLEAQGQQLTESLIQSANRGDIELSAEEREFLETAF